MKKTTRVLVVDDSPIMRELLTDILTEAPDIEVVGAASDPFEAREMIKSLNPDVATLDIEMPKMDGLDFLDKIMRLRPMPVVMISGLTQENSEVALQALELGAVDVIAKSKINVDMSIAEKSAEIIDKVRQAASAKLQGKNFNHRNGRNDKASAKLPGDYDPTTKLVVVGASAGGVEAIFQLLQRMPANCPGMVITQHMPATFTKKFAERLNSNTAVAVKEANNNEVVRTGHVYIAPGDQHLEIRKSRKGFVCKLSDGPSRSGHKPSIDVLFDSAAKAAGEDSIGVILTGMGQDGAEGLLAMRQSGAVTLGQDEASCMVYGIPKVAFEKGAVSRQLPLDRLARAILSYCTPENIRKKKSKVSVR